MGDETDVQLIAQIDRIADKLDHLRETDRTFSVFGSDSHGYLLVGCLQVIFSNPGASYYCDVAHTFSLDDFPTNGIARVSEEEESSG